PEGRARLDQAVQVMQQNPTLRVAIEGHTDGMGADVYNEGLSERRAESVKSYLMSQGIDAARMTDVRGFGESKPVASNDTEEGRARNRRVEIIAQ
ncbi:MAG: OmpA family protein, partial [Candidatus Binatia bacterium]